MSSDRTLDQQMRAHSSQGCRFELGDRGCDDGYMGASGAVVVCAARAPSWVSLGGEQRAGVHGELDRGRIASGVICNLPRVPS